MRIAGEALANVSRHARARHCQITLGTAGELAALTIGDDGTGPPAGTPGRGVGLDSMRQRATELGGSFTIEARPAGGTMVRALLPAGSHPAAPGNTPPPSAAITDTGTGGT